VHALFTMDSLALHLTPFYNASGVIIFNNLRYVTCTSTFQCEVCAEQSGKNANRLTSTRSTAVQAIRSLKWAYTPFTLSRVFRGQNDCNGSVHFCMFYTACSLFVFGGTLHEC